MSKDKRSEPFGIYIHWPFCEAKCPYCDFNSHVRHKPVDQARFVAAYQRELEHMAGATSHLQVSSVFFGGGTPSLMEPSTVGAILTHIHTLWSVEPDCEITLEANPSSVETKRFAGYAKAGVNRVSLGVQSLKNADLKALGRLHSVEEALKAIAIAKEHFERVSIDLIYARAHQLLDEWDKELQQALDLKCDHYSLYQLTIEPETPFEKLYQLGKLPMPDDEKAADFYQLTQEKMMFHGLPGYEISNHARQGQESRHNLLYWRYGLYAGVGAGAQGRLPQSQGRIATRTYYNPEQWLTHVEQHNHGIQEQENIDYSAMADEMLLMGLRLREGLCVKRFEAVTGYSLDQSVLKDLYQENLILSPDNDRIIVSAKGRFVMNAIVTELARCYI
jgi:putative oxygen-independent coproporphyrinogen III oxidase